MGTGQEAQGAVRQAGKPERDSELVHRWLAAAGSRGLCRAAGGARRYGEVFALRDQTAFVMTERVDGKLIVPKAVKVIRMAAE